MISLPSNGIWKMRWVCDQDQKLGNLFIYYFANDNIFIVFFLSMFLYQWNFATCCCLLRGSLVYSLTTIINIYVFMCIYMYTYIHYAHSWRLTTIIFKIFMHFFFVFLQQLDTKESGKYKKGLENNFLLQLEWPFQLCQFAKKILSYVFLKKIIY